MLQIPLLLYPAAGIFTGAPGRLHLLSVPERSHVSTCNSCFLRVLFKRIKTKDFSSEKQMPCRAVLSWQGWRGSGTKQGRRCTALPERGAWTTRIPAARRRAQLPLPATLSPATLPWAQQSRAPPAPTCGSRETCTAGCPGQGPRSPVPGGAGLRRDGRAPGSAGRPLGSCSRTSWCPWGPLRGPGSLRAGRRC